MRAIRISQWGGPEVLELVEDAPVPEPDEQGVLVRVTAAGVSTASKAMDPTTVSDMGGAGG